jgi:hypothetical protein
MKVSHEVPLAYLEDSLIYNDYDYLLPHLYDQYKGYKEFFLNSKASNRYIIMDNSLHELGSAYDANRMLEIIKEIIPNEFIIPDVWENHTLSMRNAKYWSQIDLPEGVTKVAVVQGKSLSEIVECYHVYKLLGYQKIAFSYGASYYNDLFPHPNKDQGKALGRIYVISKLISEGIIQPYDRIHLLGCSLPQEFLYYKNISQIETIDTSNPIMAAFERTYYEPFGLESKPKIKIDEVFNSSFDSQIQEFILYNTTEFKLINDLKRTK